MEVKETIIEPPDLVFEIYKTKNELIPSIIETEYYTRDALQVMLKKNNLLWSNKKFNGYETVYNEGLIEFNETTTLFYFVRKIDEDTYKFFCLCEESSTDSIVFYINQLKKYKTI